MTELHSPKWLQSKAAPLLKPSSGDMRIDISSNAVTLNFIYRLLSQTDQSVLKEEYMYVLSETK